jgi:hypothetical protein
LSLCHLLSKQATVSRKKKTKRVPAPQAANATETTPPAPRYFFSLKDSDDIEEGTKLYVRFDRRTQSAQLFDGKGTNRVEITSKLDEIQTAHAVMASMWWFVDSRVALKNVDFHGYDLENWAEVRLLFSSLFVILSSLFTPSSPYAGSSSPRDHWRSSQSRSLPFRGVDFGWKAEDGGNGLVPQGSSLSSSPFFFVSSPDRLLSHSSLSARRSGSRSRKETESASGWRKTWSMATFVPLLLSSTAVSLR